MKMVESHQLIWGVAATDVEYDWKGRLVVSDFITGWESHDAGRIITLSADKVWKPEAAATVATLMKDGFAKRGSAELAQLLAHADQRVRLRAQIELTRRPDAAERFEAATKSANPLERVHGIWGLGILARRGAAIAPSEAFNGKPTPVAPLAARVAAARARQAARFAAHPSMRVNADMEGSLLEETASPDAEGRDFLARAAERFGLTARGYHRILRVARTIADLDGSEAVRRPHIAEAVGYRLVIGAKG
jgi:hypothetical protein